MGNVSGIDAQGPWFDGVEVLKEKEIGAVNVAEAKAKSMFRWWRSIGGCASTILIHCDCRDRHCGSGNGGLDGFCSWMIALFGVYG